MYLVRRLDRMPGKPYWLGFIAIALLSAIVAFFQEDVALFNSNWSNHFTLTEFSITLAAVVAAFLGVGVLAYQTFGVRFEWKTALWTGSLALCVIIGVLVLPERYYFSDSDTAYYVTEATRFRFGAKGVIDCVYLYFFFAVFPKMVRGRKTMDWVCRLMIVAVLGIVLYSVVFEWSKYVTFFTQTLLDGQTISFLAFFENKNIFGMALLFGFMAAMYLHGRYKKFWQIVLMLFFTVVTVVVDCRTVMACEGLAFSGYMIYRFAMTISKHPWKDSFALAFFVLILICLAIPIASPEAVSSVPFLSNFGYLIRNSFLEMGSATMGSRVDFWKACMQMLSDSVASILFGMGGELVSYILAVRFGTHHWGDYGASSTHNGFIFVICKFGFVGFAIYVAFIILLLIAVFRYMKRHDDSFGAVLFMLVAAFAHAMAENTMFFGSTVQMICFSLLAVFPVLLKREEERRAALGPEEPEYLPIKPKAAYLPRLCLLFGCFFTAFAFASPSLGFFTWKGMRFGEDWISYICLTAAALVLPRFMRGLKGKNPLLSLAAFAAYIGSLAACYFLPGYAGLLIVVFLIGAGVLMSARLEKDGLKKNTCDYLKSAWPFLIGWLASFLVLFLVGINVRMLSDYSVIALLALTLIFYLFLLFMTPLSGFAFPRWLCRYSAMEEALWLKIRTKEKIPEGNNGAVQAGGDLLPGVVAEEHQAGKKEYLKIHR